MYSYDVVNTDGPRITCALILYSQLKSAKIHLGWRQKQLQQHENFFRVARYTAYTRAAPTIYLEFFIYACVVGFA